MKKVLFIITAVAFLFTACEKDNQQSEAIQNAAQDGATIEFKIDQTDFGYKNTVPMCNDELDMNYVKFTVLDSAQVTTSYKSMIYYIGGEMLTQVIKLPVGTYQVTSFVVYNDNGTPDDENDDVIVRAAPLPGSEYYDLMQFKLNLEFTVDAFYKKQYEIDVLCFEELFYSEFGFTWFEFNDVRIERQCIFGDICVDDYADYDGSAYEGQANGIQFDLPAIFEIHVFKGDDVDPLRIFSNADWLGEGQCLEVYWPNRLDVEGEVFNFELWVLLPTANGFDYVLMDTWTFLDGEGATTGADGVVDFVIGDCHLYPADYEYEYQMDGYGPLHDPVLEIQFDDPNGANIHIATNGTSYFTINGGDNNGIINEYDLNFNLIATYNIAVDGRGLSYNNADGYLYASLFLGDIIKITDLASGAFTVLYPNKMQDPQSCFALSADGTKFYDFYQGTLKVWDLATGSLLETINGLNYGASNWAWGGESCVAVDPDYIYTWDADANTVFVYDHSGVFQQSLYLSQSGWGYSLSFANGYLFVNSTGFGGSTWYGYNIRNEVLKKSIEIENNSDPYVVPESSTTLIK